MLRLALRTLRFRRGSFVASFIALFFGAVIVMACGGLMETGIVSAVPPQRLAAAAVVVTGDRSRPEPVRLDRALTGRIQAVSGVAAAVPDVAFPATVLRDGAAVGGGLAAGHGWASAALAPYSVTEGRAPERSHDVVLDATVAVAAGVGVGQDIDIAVHGENQRFRVSGVATGPGPAIFFAERDVPSLAPSPSTVDSIGVLAAPGVDPGQLRDRIAAVAGTALALTGDDRGLAEFDDVPAAAETLIVLAAVFGGLAIMVAVFVVASTLTLSIQQRDREMALLRAIGATPGQLRGMVLAETAVVALLAAAAAYLPNRMVGRWLLGEMANRGVVPAALVYHQSWIPTISATGIALLTALTAAFLAGRRAATARPTDALAHAALPQHWLNWFRLLFAVLCLGGGLALTIVTAVVMHGPVAASTAAPTAMLWSGGIALLSPGLTRVVGAVVRQPLRLLSGVSGWLALLNARARRIRLAGAVTAIMLAIGLPTALIYLQTTQAVAADEAFAQTLSADAVLTSAAGGFEPAFIGTVDRVPGVATASALVNSGGYLEGPEVEETGNRDVVPLEGVSTDGVGTLAITPTKGTLTALRGDTVAITGSEADSLGKTVGDTIPLWLGDNTELRVTIVALFDTRPGYESALVPDDVLLPHTRTGLVPQILVRAAPGVDQAALLSRLTALSGEQPGLGVAGRSAVVTAHAQQEQTGLWVNYLLIGMIIGYAVISLVNTLVVATGERRRELGLQRLIGSTSGQVLRMMSTEAVLMTIIGTVLGTAVAATALIPFSLAVSDSPLPRGPLWIYLSVVGGAAALTLVATLIPTMAALRVPAIAAADAE